MAKIICESARHKIFGLSRLVKRFSRPKKNSHLQSQIKTLQLIIAAPLSVSRVKHLKSRLL